MLVKFPKEKKITWSIRELESVRIWSRQLKTALLFTERMQVGLIQKESNMF